MDNDALQDLRKEAPQPEEPLLQPARGGSASESGTDGGQERLRVFGAAVDPHGERRDRTANPESVHNNPGLPVDTDLRIASILKRVMIEQAADKFQEDGSRMTNLEVLVRKLVDRALDENQFAMETVLDRFEGKPVRANQVQAADTALEEQIDKASIAALNSLVEQPK